VEVTVAAAATAYFLERRMQNVLCNVTYSPSYRQAGAPVNNVQSTIRTVPICVKIFQLQYHLAATVIHIQSLRSRIYVYIYVYIHNIYIYIYIYIETLVGQKRHLKN
jgi:hypothetical protein